MTMPRTHALSAFRFVSILLVLTLAAAVAAQDDPNQVESLDAASYQIFAIDDHAQSATLQATETADGGARIVVSLPGTASVNASQAVLYHGDCGPDRPIALRLTPFDNDNDPLTSVTQDEAWTFGRLTEADLFVYVFAGADIDVPESAGLDGEVLACGEVGLNANR